MLAVLALAAGAAVAVVVAWRAGGGGGGAAASTGRPLSGSPPVRVELPGPAVDYGDPGAVERAAEQRLQPGDVRLQIARVMVGYTHDRAGAIAALERLPQSNPAVAFNLGVAQLWDGQLTAATQSLLRAHRLDPYGFYGATADKLLFSKSELDGYPPYFPPFSTPKPAPRELRAAARAHPGDSGAWLRLAVALERSSLPDARVQAIAAARRSLADDPTGIDPRVAVAVLAFDKANPASSVGTLGTMARDAPDNAEIRFHLGLLFFWIRRFDDAAGEMRQVVASNPGPPYGQLAKVFEVCLTSQQSCAGLLQSAG